MAKIYSHAFLGSEVVPVTEANVSVASAAVLYGLSVYTVFRIVPTAEGFAAFRFADHWKRLMNSARIIGIDTFEQEWSEQRFMDAVRAVVEANEINEDAFVRATVHVSELVPGVRSRGLETTVSLFIYEAACILPKSGARLKTSVWRRVPDFSIPSRAKVNGAYVNSVLARQDALDSGYDDCVFLDMNGHVCELSAANLFIVRDGVIHTPSQASDVLEGISRKTVIEIARDLGYTVCERTIDLTELYIADEAFACGTSANLTPVIEIDKRKVGNGGVGPISEKLQGIYEEALSGKAEAYRHLLAPIS
jgi:branched-chain amino acid aminotransferase